MGAAGAGASLAVGGTSPPPSEVELAGMLASCGTMGGAVADGARLRRERMLLRLSVTGAAEDCGDGTDDGAASSARPANGELDWRDRYVDQGDRCAWNMNGTM